MGYKIASFNVCNMSYGSDKAWDIIAKIILSEKFDIVALQEVLSGGNALKYNLLPYLGSDWAYEWDKPNKYETIDNDDDKTGDKRGEGYAYLWNTRIFQKVRTRIDSSFVREAEPHILNKQSRDVSGINAADFFRAPYYARFVPCSIGAKLFIELRLINAHLYFGSAGNADVEKRKKEFDLLMRNVLPELEDKRYGNQRPAYTIILGDYNLNLDRPRNKYPQSPILSMHEEYIEILEGKRKKVIRTAQEGMTTLKKEIDPTAENRGAEYKKSYRFKNNYDHFSYDEEYFNNHGVAMSCRKVDAIRKYYGNDFDGYRKKISDHLPIVLEINF